MATINPKSFIRRLFPTSHRLLLIRKIIPLIKNLNGKILVLGAGYWPTKDQFNKNSSVIFSDIDINYPQVSIFANAHNLPFKDETFSGILALEVFEHLENPNVASDEILRVLKKDGQALISIPFMFRIHGNPSDFQRFTKSGLELLFKKFSDVKIIGYGSRIHVISDLITTANPFLFFLRILNYLLLIFECPAKDAPSGYIVLINK